ncbi:hypothetical protein [Actinopolymorpha pittospori]|uniref:Uncharacterized protein n=1 Tax=Actinopolymorpha pittospori TaxID=648752 RepID=A0A927N977_9ACTN|nr:hypothetical protein [Actinopolymorpha pittospori]MBE1610675.1 hypothetical protein [Actinopolymorpha pittospori]
MTVELRGPRLDRIVLDGAFNASARRVGLRRRPVLTLGVPLWNILDPQERVDLRRAEDRQLRIDETHPPTHLRWKLVAERPRHVSARVVLGAAESRAIDAELAPGYAEIAQQVRAQVLDRLGRASSVDGAGQGRGSPSRCRTRSGPSASTRVGSLGPRSAPTSRR